MLENEQPRVRISLRWKITLPFIVLAIALGLGLGILVNQQLRQAEEVSFLRQLRDSGQQAADEVVRIEASLLEVQRAISNTEGVPEAVALSRAEELRARILQIVVTTETDVAVVLDREGTSLLAIRRSEPDAPLGDYLTLRGEGYYQSWPFVRTILGIDPKEVGENTEGDKQAGMHAIQLGEQEVQVLFVGGPMTDRQGDVYGAVLIGKYLENVTRDLGEIAGAHISSYDSEAGTLVSTDFSIGDPWNPPGLTLNSQLVQTALDAKSGEAPYRTIQIAGQTYGEVLTPFQIRNGTVQLGLMGISLLGGEEADVLYQQYRQQASNLLLFGVLALVLVIGTGLLVSGWVTRPLVDLTEATHEAAMGNLETIVTEGTKDEFGALAQTFNRMLTGIREETLYRNLLGQDPTLETKEHLKKTLVEGGRLAEGQTVKATVLHAEISGFSTDAEKADPSRVIRTLNDALTGIIPVIYRHGGVLDTLAGGEVKAYFGVFPRGLPMQVSSLQATHAGMELLDYIHALNEKRVSWGMPPLDVSVGIASGWVIAGGIGVHGSLQYTVLGDTVAAAQRIQEAANSVHGGTVLISEETHEYLSGARSQFKIGRYGRLPLEEGGQEIGIYEVEGRTERLIDMSDSDKG
ncbi:MAG: HAMP domain-containing protein [Anaerolineales bacterium]|nr:HAMP domain-containing protein [Anaerolineales bacterium]